MKLTAENISDLLKGYRMAYPILRDYLRDELLKEQPSKKVCEDTVRELYLYELLYKTVMSLHIRYRNTIICRFFSENPKTVKQTAIELGINPTTVCRRTKEGSKRILAIMNATLTRLEKEENLTKPNPCARNGQKTSHRYPTSRAKPTKRQGQD